MPRTVCKTLIFATLGGFGIIINIADSLNVNTITDLPIDWNARASEELERSLGVAPIVARARNVILFVGDGMGISTLTAARVFRAQNVTRQREEDGSLSWEDFPYTGLIKTYSADYLTPDSAATATAFMTGEKARQGMIAISQEVKFGDCQGSKGRELTSALHHAVNAGMWTGVITTSSLTDATPAAAYAHAASRGWKVDYSTPSGCQDIALQLIDNSINQKINVLLGGGSRYFRGRRDERNLIQEWQDKKGKEKGTKHKFVRTKAELDAINTTEVDYVFGLFSKDVMKFEFERQRESSPQQPSVTDMVNMALSVLSRSEKGYFLYVEGGRVDHAHHSNMAYLALSDTVALSDAVTAAAAVTDEADTLMAVTADHSHTFTIAGYQSLRNGIFGLVSEDGKATKALDKNPYLTLGYANGPGFEYHRVDQAVKKVTVRKNLKKDYETAETFSPFYQQDAGVPLKSETHGGEDVAVYARGPMAHLLGGQHEQSYVAHAVMYAACLGPRYSYKADFCHTEAGRPRGRTEDRYGAQRQLREEAIGTHPAPNPTLGSPAEIPSSDKGPCLCERESESLAQGLLPTSMLYPTTLILVAINLVGT